MNCYSRILRPIISAIALPVLVMPTAVGGETARTVKVAASEKKPPAANNAIIPLPLTPVVPAGQRSCAARTPTGLGYSILRPGTGPRPAEADTVLVNYIGYLATTGTVFDQGMRSPLPVADVIPGFSQGLQMAARSAVVRLCIPAALGYGPQASAAIPANSDLVFQIELLDYKTPAELDAMRASAGRAGATEESTAPQP